MHDWQVNKKAHLCKPVNKGYARKIKTTRFSGGCLFCLNNYKQSETIKTIKETTSASIEIGINLFPFAIMNTKKFSASESELTHKAT